VAATDEILQMLFWVRGEGLAADADTADLARFSGLTEARIAGLLGRLTAQGLLRATTPGRGALTEDRRVRGRQAVRRRVRRHDKVGSRRATTLIANAAGRAMSRTEGIAPCDEAPSYGRA
jgi:hypothetical protein